MYGHFELLAYETGIFPQSIEKLPSNLSSEVLKVGNNSKTPISTTSSNIKSEIGLSSKNKLKSKFKYIYLCLDNNQVLGSNNIQKVVKTSSNKDQKALNMKNDKNSIQKQVASVYNKQKQVCAPDQKLVKINIENSKVNLQNLKINQILKSPIDSKNQFKSAGCFKSPEKQVSRIITQNLNNKNQRCISGFNLNANNNKKTIENVLSQNIVDKYTPMIIKNKHSYNQLQIKNKINDSDNKAQNFNNKPTTRRINVSSGSNQIEILKSEQNINNDCKLSQINFKRTPTSISNMGNYKNLVKKYKDSNITSSNSKGSFVFNNESKSSVIINNTNSDFKKGADIDFNSKDTPDKDIFNSLFISVQDYSNIINFPNKNPNINQNNNAIKSTNNFNDTDLNSILCDYKSKNNQAKPMIKSKSNFIISKVVSSDGKIIDLNNIKGVLPDQKTSIKSPSQEITNINGKSIDIIESSFEDNKPDSSYSIDKPNDDKLVNDSFDENENENNNCDEKVTILKNKIANTNKNTEQNQKSKHVESLEDLIKDKNKFHIKINEYKQALSTLIGKNISEQLLQEGLHINESNKNYEEYIRSISEYAEKNCPDNLEKVRNNY